MRPARWKNFYRLSQAFVYDELFLYIQEALQLAPVLSIRLSLFLFQILISIQSVPI